MEHDLGLSRRRDLTDAEKRELAAAFARFEGHTRLAAALGMTEDTLRASFGANASRSRAEVAP